MRNTLLAATLIAPGLAAQTYIVDANGGPGTNFTSLPAAVSAAPDGAILRVRPGSYSGFTAVGKGLVILGEPGVTITSQIRWFHAGGRQPVVLRDLHLQPPSPTGVPLIVLTTCNGPVLLEGVTNTPGCNQAAFCDLPLSANRCEQIVLRNCTLLGAVWLGTEPNDPSQASIENCTLIGHSVPQVIVPSVALALRYTSVQIVSSIVIGGGGSPTGLGRGNYPGIGGDSFDLRVLDSAIASGASAPHGGWAIDATGQSTVRIDLASGLAGVNGPTSGVTPRRAAMPHLEATGASPGGTLTAWTTTVPGDVVMLAIGLRYWRLTAVPGITDAFWIDPSAHVLHTIGTQQTGTPVTGSIPVPNSAGFVGLQLLWHAACYGPVTGLQNSNPAVSLIR